MKTTKISTLVFLSLFICLFFVSKVKSQVYTLNNNFSCDVTVSYEIGDPPACPSIGNNTPCGSGILTVPAGSFVTIAACGNGTIWEVCIVLEEVDYVTQSAPKCHHNLLLGLCCQAGNCTSGSVNPGSACAVAGTPYTVNVTGTVWTIW